MLSDDLLITPTLLRRFELEAQFEDGDGRYYAIIRCENGRIVPIPFCAWELKPDQRMFAEDVLRKLNRELHHDGAWVICFTHVKRPSLECVLLDIKDADYARYALIWVDRDGDPQVTQDWMEGTTDELRDFAAVLAAGIESLMAKCETSWLLWHEMMVDVIEPEEGQTYKRAQGQRAPSAH
jgi:hypothetical protein